MHISTTGGAGLSSGLSHIQSNAPSSGLGRAGSGKVSEGGLGEVGFSEASGRGREGGCSLCDGQTVLHPETRSTRRMVSAHPVGASSEGGDALSPPGVLLLLYASLEYRLGLASFPITLCTHVYVKTVC